MAIQSKLIKLACYLVALSVRIKSDISGATAVEYGLLAGLVALGIAGGIGALSDLVVFMFEMIAGETSDVAATVNSGG